MTSLPRVERGVARAAPHIRAMPPDTLVLANGFSRREQIEQRPDRQLSVDSTLGSWVACTRTASATRSRAALRRVSDCGEIDRTPILRDDPIALAGPLLDEGAIDDFHRARPFPHSTVALQSLQGCRNPGSAYAEHFGQQILRERNGVVLEPIVGQKQPSGQSFLELVANIAQDGLFILDEQPLDMDHELLPKRRAFIHCLPKVL